MDHVVYLDAKAEELKKLICGEKSKIIRGAAGRKMPYGRVSPGDIFYFLDNDAEGLIKAKAHVQSVINSDILTKEESINLIKNHQAELQLTENQMARWSGKRYLVIIEVDSVEQVEPFRVDKSKYGNMDDWLPVENIDNIRV